MSTQVELAVQGTITAAMKQIASQEGLEPETIRQRVAEGQIVVPLNANHPVRVVGIGMGLRSKVNASIGTSTDIADIDAEVRKAKAAEAAGADTLMELSVGGDLDRVAHSLFSYSETKRFDLGAFSKGETRGVLLDKPGVVDIYCAIHPSMHARVVVVSSPFFTRTSLNGDYEIQGVPAGKYVLSVWNEHFHGQAREIFVSETGEVRADLTLEK